MEKQSVKMAERIRQDKLSKSRVREILSQKPLFKQREEEYVGSEMTALQERKKQLEDIRNFYKPVDRAELIEHQHTYKHIK